MSSADLASRRWIYEQYDSDVMADTLAASGGDAALVRVHGTNHAVSTDCTPRYVEADPFEGLRLLLKRGGISVQQELSHWQ